MVKPCWMLVAPRKRLPGSHVGFGFKVLGLCQTCPCTGQTTTFKSNAWALRDVTSFFGILQSVSVDQSGSLTMEIGVLNLSHAMLVLAELLVCSTKGFACILAKSFWNTEMSLSDIWKSRGFMQ